MSHSDTRYHIIIRDGHEYGDMDYISELEDRVARLDEREGAAKDRVAALEAENARLRAERAAAQDRLYKMVDTFINPT